MKTLRETLDRVKNEAGSFHSEIDPNRENTMFLDWTRGNLSARLPNIAPGGLDIPLTDKKKLVAWAEANGELYNKLMGELAEAGKQINQMSIEFEHDVVALVQAMADKIKSEYKI